MPTCNVTTAQSCACAAHPPTRRLPFAACRSVDSLTVKELYTIKNETENRALNAKLLSSLFEKPSTLGVTVASVTNTPLITQYIMSPIVARSMMKDPEARKK